MKAQVVVDLEFHPAVDADGKLKRIIEAYLREAYAIDHFSVSINPKD